MSFWKTYAQRQTTRRRALAGIGLATTATALTLAGCGGDKDSGSKGAGRILHKPTDSSGSAKSGGAYKAFLNIDVPSFDPLSSGATTTQGLAMHTYPRMLKFKTSVYPAEPAGEVEGDLAESFELSPDKLQLTMKLRQGLRWDSRAPTSGRVIDADDVVFSWNKYARLSPFSADVAYKPNNTSAPVESATAVDPRTVVFKMRQPDAAVTILFANMRTLNVMPRESDGGFDPKGEIRGYGPWLLEEYAPSVRVVWRKNPDYYVKGRPFFDRKEAPILPEYASANSQFRAGNIYAATENAVRLDDILTTKKDIAELLVLQGTQFGDGGVHEYVSFGYEGDSPFKDQRVRQAVALLIDREAYTDVLTNQAEFQAAGIETPVRWVTWVPSSFQGYWLDPRDEKAFGPNAGYYKHDVPEAKKLLAAAGFTSGVKTTYAFQANRDFAYDKLSPIIPNLLLEGGITADSKVLNSTQYVEDLLRVYATGNTKGFNGIGQRTAPTSATVYLGMFAQAHPGGRNFVGMTPDGRNASAGDPAITSLVDNIKTEFDVQKQQAIAHEFQRQMAIKAYAVPLLVDSPLFTMAWPCIGNYGSFVTQPGSVVTTEGELQWWLDDTKPPVRRV
jgi:ABC-type transport system substrate-binding protein